MKKFFVDFRMQFFLFEASLGPCLSTEIIGVVMRCVNRFLLRQTQAVLHFQILVLLKSPIVKVEDWSLINMMSN